MGLPSGPSEFHTLCYVTFPVKIGTNVYLFYAGQQKPDLSTVW